MLFAFISVVYYRVWGDRFEVGRREAIWSPLLRSSAVPSCQVERLAWLWWQRGSCWIQGWLEQGVQCLGALCVSLQGHSPHPGERRERVRAGVQGEVLQGHGHRGQEVRQHPQGGGRGCRLLPPVQPDLQLRDRDPGCALCHRQGR